jgi:hypothetical protein
MGCIFAWPSRWSVLDDDPVRQAHHLLAAERELGRAITQTQRAHLAQPEHERVVRAIACGRASKQRRADAVVLPDVAQHERDGRNTAG